MDGVLGFRVSSFIEITGTTKAPPSTEYRLGQHMAEDHHVR